MTHPLLTLGARLRAATTGDPVAIATYAPALPPVNGIAITITTDGDHTYLTATDGRTEHTAADRDALAALETLGATCEGVHRTLIVGTTTDLDLLVSLARTYPDAAASPVIGWWDQRADMPGSEAVHIAVRAASQRWVLGVTPDAERSVQTWLSWLNIPTTGARGLYDLALATTDGHTLPGLLDAAQSDTYSWEHHTKRVKAGRPWWAPDTRMEAALGLAARSDATEWFDALRLSDPTVAASAAYDGQVVPGTVIDTHDHGLVIAATQPLSRLRPDTRIIAWRNHPGIIELNGRIETQTIDPTGTLTITVTDVSKTTLKHWNIGDPITLRPPDVDVYSQARGRSWLARGYKRGTNWIGSGKTAPVRRSPVPLDVVVAAAD